MNDPAVLRFVREVVRPIAQDLRAIRAALGSADQTYQSGIGAMLYAAAAEQVDDGREAEGVSRLTCSDVIGFMNKVEAAITLLDADSGAAVIAKPCVRPLEVQ